MIIIASGANASAKNIGQVEVPITWDVSAAAYLSHIPVAAASLNYAKNRALNTFFKGLKAAGLWTKIEHIYLPVFGRSEGGVNLKTPTYNIGFPSASTTATYDSKGVKFLLGWQAPITHSWDDIHAGFYNTTSNAADIAIRAAIASSNSWVIGRRCSTNQSGILCDSVYRAQIQNHIASIGPIITSCDSANKAVRAVIDGEYTEKTDTATFPGVPTQIIMLGGNQNNGNSWILDSSIGLFTIGSKLVQSELTTYSSLQTALMSALLA